MKGSVWSALPPINVSSLERSKPIILTVASMDSASFFRDKSLGADSPISGMISLLAAVDALSYLDGLHDLSKQLVFVVFTGEAWGYLGSRRFLLELDQNSDAVYGLNNSLIEKVYFSSKNVQSNIEIGFKTRPSWLTRKEQIKRHGVRRENDIKLEQEALGFFCSVLEEACGRKAGKDWTGVVSEEWKRDSLCIYQRQYVDWQPFHGLGGDIK
ncbi:unnamed protein product [Ilex paraguariensis]|uniref:Nicastrin n=1 Tax=Ilex paraguariensis TaxID=185542 RepID=A0ABC8QZI0_9AQUA